MFLTQYRKHRTGEEINWVIGMRFIALPMAGKIDEDNARLVGNLPRYRAFLVA
jgi:hypothetical protein